MPPSAAAVSRAKHRTAARGQWVTASADFSSISMRYLRAVARPVAQGIESEMVPIAEHAIEGWPVRTGRSRDAILLAVDASGGDKISAKISNDVRYVYYVKRGTHSRYSKTADRPENLRRGRPAWVDLVRRPFRGVEDRIARYIEQNWGR
jgi:hypothetical protein